MKRRRGTLDLNVVTSSSELPSASVKWLMLSAELQICFIEKATQARLKKGNKRNKHFQQFTKKNKWKFCCHCRVGGEGRRGGVGGVGGSIRFSPRTFQSVLGPSTSSSRGPLVVDPWNGSAVRGSVNGSGAWREKRTAVILWIGGGGGGGGVCSAAAPFPAAAVQLPPKFPGYGFQMHEVAEAPTGALSGRKRSRKGLIWLQPWSKKNLPENPVFIFFWCNKVEKQQVWWQTRTHVHDASAHPQLWKSGSTFNKRFT